MQQHKDLKEYKEALYSALFPIIDKAFPEMDFTLKGKGNNKRWISPKHINGQPSHSKDQTFIGEALKSHISDFGNGGGTLSIIDFEMKRTGSSFPEALLRLGSLCGLSFAISEEAKEYERKQQQQEEVFQKSVKALWGGSPEADKVLSYLRSRNWTDEEIREAGLGYIDREIAQGLPIKSHKNVGDTHRLVIPFRSGSSLQGFKFRNIDYQKGDTLPKYLNSTGLAKGDGLFSMPLGFRDITIVEGELDALHAKAKGISNITATAGGAITETQARDAIRRGVKRFTLLFDNDKAGAEFTFKSVEVLERIAKEGTGDSVSVFVASLPEGAKDTDEFLASHSIEEWEAVTNQTSKAAPLWKYSQKVYEFARIGASQGGELTGKQKDDFFQAIHDIIYNAPAILKQEIRNELKNDQEALRFDITEYWDYLEREAEDKDRKKQGAMLAKAIDKMKALANEGNFEEAIAFMKATSTEQAIIGGSKEFARLFSLKSPEDIEAELSEIPEGIPTGITFGKGTATEEKLTLYTGLTFICGCRGHGKTTLLNNIAINEAKRNIRLKNDKKVLYFTFEITERMLRADLLNIYINDMEISNNPLNSILSFFRSKGINAFAKFGQRYNDRQRQADFIQKKDRFLSEYLSSGRLTIVGERYTTEKMLDAIRYFLKYNSVSLICIDYAQLLTSEEAKKQQRTEELKQILGKVSDLAKEADLPILMACQFNREVASPVSITTNNIGEGGDIERIADTCIGLYNLKELNPLPKNKPEEAEAKTLLKRLMGDSFNEADSLKPIQGKMFVRLMKRRNGHCPQDIILDWRGRTKQVLPNSPEDLEPKAEQAKISEQFPDF